MVVRIHAFEVLSNIYFSLINLCLLDIPLAKSSKADGSAKSGKEETTVDAKAEKVGSAKSEKSDFSSKGEKMSSKLIVCILPPYYTCTPLHEMMYDIELLVVV
jgi:hypothetical protein